MRGLRHFVRLFINLLSEEELSRLRMALLALGLLLSLGLWGLLVLKSSEFETAATSTSETGPQTTAGGILSLNEWSAVRQDLTAKNPFLTKTRVYQAAPVDEPEVSDLPGYSSSGMVEVNGNKRAFVTDPSGNSLYLTQGAETGSYRVLSIGNGEILLSDRSVTGSPKDILNNTKIKKFRIRIQRL